MVFVPISKADLEGPEVEPGRYLARIDKATFKKSGAGNPMIMAFWTLQGDAPPAGLKIMDTFTMIPEAYWRINLMMAATGYEAGEEGFDTDDLLGLECWIDLGKESEEKGGRLRVNGYYKEAA